MAVRVLIIDGSSAVRDAIRRNLECIGCDVVAEAATADQAVLLFRTVEPEIVTLGVDLRYGDESSPLGLLRLIKREVPKTSVLMVARALLLDDAQTFKRAGSFGMFRGAAGIRQLMAHPVDGASRIDGWYVCHHDVGDRGAQS